MGEIWGGFVGFMEQALFWLSMITGSTGLGIILFTVCVRVMLLPLTVSSIKSSRRMQELQPMVKELQRKYGKDKAKLQEETVKLYKQYKVNPAGSCLPMLLQLPIFIAVYWAVLHLMDPNYQEQLIPTIYEKVTGDPQVQEILHRPFLGIDLGTKPFGGSEFDLDNFQGVTYLVLPVLAILLQVMQQLMAMPRVQDPQQRAMSKIMLIMPLFFFYITLIFPAGAVLYWVTSSAIGVIQTYFTSGWGSLANYLKFLPPDAKAKAAGMATPATAGAGAAASGAIAAGPSSTDALGERETTTSPAPARQTFWDVLRPLTEATGDFTGEELLGETNAPIEKPLEQPQPRRQNRQPPNPRRSRRRR